MIIQRSHKDRLWGSVPCGAEMLVGINLFGVLLVDLCKEARTTGNNAMWVVSRAP
jgi:hypothetical protein